MTQQFRAKILAWSCALAALSLFATSAAVAQAPKLKVSPNGSFLVTENGTPFFWLADTNWRLHKLTREQVLLYLNQRRNLGFNVIQGPVLLAPQATGETMTAYGHANTNAVTPNLNFFQHIDFIVRAALQRGLYIAPVVAWGDEWDLFSTPAAAMHYGRWLGTRYRNFPNVVWIVAGEHSIEGDDPRIDAIWDALARGLKQGSNGNHLVTIHGSANPGRQSSSVHFHHSTWLDFNMVHSSQTGNHLSGADNYNLVMIDFFRVPRKPVIDAEANYEHLGGWDAFGVRRRAYWSVFAGGFGHTYGANGVWQSLRPGDASETGPADTWNVGLNYLGARQMQHLRRLVESRPMLNRVPDQTMLLSFAGDVPLRIQAVRDAGGRYAMFYVPQTRRFFAVNMAKLRAPAVRAWWFNTQNGRAFTVGQFPATGVRMFVTPPVGEDWVLVLDSTSAAFPTPPGVGGPFR